MSTVPSSTMRIVGSLPFLVLFPSAHAASRLKRMVTRIDVKCFKISCECTCEGNDLGTFI